MAIDWNDCITFKNKDGGRLPIPRSSILSVKTKTEKDYSGSAPYPDKEVTHLFVKIDTAQLLGIDISHQHKHDVGVFIPVLDKYEIVMGIMRGDKAVEVLF